MSISWDTLYNTWALFHYPMRHLRVRSCHVSKPRDLHIEMHDRSEFWQAHRQQCYRGVIKFQIDAMIRTTNLAASGFHKIHTSLIAWFMGPTWGPSGADRTQVGPMLTPWTLLSGLPWTSGISDMQQESRITGFASFVPRKASSI